VSPRDPPPISYRAVFADLLVRLAEACREVYGGRLVSLAVFGSVARDRPRPDSDIDLLLVVDCLPSAGIAPTEEFAAVEARMEPCLERARREGVDTRLSPIIRSAAEAETAGFPFIDMALEARILLDRDRFLADAVERLRQGLAGSGAERVVTRGPAHWRVKPTPGKGGSRR